MPIPTPVNNFSTTLALPHAIGDGVLVMRPGAGDLIRSRLAEIGAPDISADAPIRVMAASRKSMQANVAVPVSQWTIFEATGLTGDDLTGCSPVEGTADFAYEANDPLVAGPTAGLFAEILAAIRSLDEVTYSPTLSLDVTKGTLHKVTATGDATVDAGAAGYAGQEMTVLIVNDATPRTITFGANFRAASTLVGAASKAATVRFVSDGASWFETSRATGL
jgi:hypothetical protein